MKDIALSTLGLAGILLHSLIKLYQQKKQPTWPVLKEYFKSEWLCMLISAIIVGVSLLCKKEILQLDIAGNVAGNYLGIVFFLIGYAGQSILLPFLKNLASKAGVKDDTIQTILILVGLTMLCSCANEKKFVRYHEKQPAKAIGYCLVWNPTKDSVHESVSYIPGETQVIPGETIYANCDSAYQSALDEAAKLVQGKGVKIIVKKVAVPCPPSTHTVDTIKLSEYEQKRYTAVEDLLRKQIGEETAKKNQWMDKAGTYLTWAKYEGLVLGLFLIVAAIIGYSVHRRF